MNTAGTRPVSTSGVASLAPTAVMTVHTPRPVRNSGWRPKRTASTRVSAPRVCCPLAASAGRAFVVVMRTLLPGQARRHRAAAGRRPRESARPHQLPAAPCRRGCGSGRSRCARMPAPEARANTPATTSPSLQRRASRTESHGACRSYKDRMATRSPSARAATSRVSSRASMTVTPPLSPYDPRKVPIGSNNRHQPRRRQGHPAQPGAEDRSRAA